MSHRTKRPSSSSSPPPPSKRPSTSTPSFPSYLTTPNLPPKIIHFCSLLSSTPPSHLDSALSSSPYTLTSSDIETILKLSYSTPSSALKFFRWSGSLLNHSHTPYSWNLTVDLLGKNHLFSPMWDAVSSMHSQSLLSLATFASLFSSFASARRPNDALQAFDIMQSRFNIPQDSAALNSLLSAVCRESQTSTAHDILKLRHHIVPPDPDSFAILLEGWESERNPHSSIHTFNQLVERFGWDPNNVPAYDSFLTTLVKNDAPSMVKYFKALAEHRCYPGMKFFKAAMEEFAAARDWRTAVFVWENLVGRNGCYPDVIMYNEMIMLQCYGKELELAMRLLDEMVVFGAFPDRTTYNVIFEWLVKERRLEEAEAILKEMCRNECRVSEKNCLAAIKAFTEVEDWKMGVRVWKCMVEYGYPLEEVGNMMVTKMKVVDRLPEACSFAEDMIEMGVKLNSATLAKLKGSLNKAGKGSVYDNILRKWKSHSLGASF